MKFLEHELVGSLQLQKLHTEGKIKKGEGESCIIGYNHNLKLFVSAEAQNEATFESQIPFITFFTFCPVCGKLNNSLA